MNFLGEITADEVEEIQQALAMLSHHNFFERMKQYRTANVLNAMHSTSDEGLPLLIRRFQAETLLLGELGRMAEEAEQTINTLYGDSNVSDLG